MKYFGKLKKKEMHFLREQKSVLYAGRIIINYQQPAKKTRPISSKCGSSTFGEKQVNWWSESSQLPTALDFHFIVILFSDSGSFMQTTQ